MAATHWVFFAGFVLFACTSADPIDDLKSIFKTLVENCRYNPSKLGEGNDRPDTVMIKGLPVNVTCGYIALNWVKKDEFNVVSIDAKAIQDYLTAISSLHKPSLANDLNRIREITIVKICSQQTADSEEKIVKKFKKCMVERRRSLFLISLISTAV